MQGLSYNLTFPRAHAPVGPLDISLYQGSNCGPEAAPLHTFPTQAASLAGDSGWVTLTMPAAVAGAGLFLQITGPTGADSAGVGGRAGRMGMRRECVQLSAALRDSDTGEAGGHL